MNILEKLKDLENNEFETKSYFKEHISSEDCIQQYTNQINFLRTLKEKSIDPDNKELTTISNTLPKKLATILEDQELEKVLDLVENEKNRQKKILKVIELLLQKEVSRKEKFEYILRVCMGILTEGVVNAPVDGLVESLIDPVDNFPRLSFAGPIRAMGGSNLAYIFLIAEYLRRKLEFNKYIPTEKEIQRTTSEVMQYTRKHPGQIRPSIAEIKKVIESCPIMIDGVETEEQTVSVHKHLPRIETPRLRGAVALIVVEGFIIRGKKILPLLKNYGLEDWEPWIKEIISLGKNARTEGERSSKDTKYALTLGRPMLSDLKFMPGLRLVVGKTPTVGLAGSNVTKELIDLIKFVNIGSQLVISLPGKATTITGVTEWLSKPIVVYEDGSIGYYEIGSFEKVKKILDLGQIMISTGDFIEYNQGLPKRDYSILDWFSNLEEENLNLNLSEEENLILNKSNPRIKLNPCYGLMIEALSYQQYMEFRKSLISRDYGLTDKKREVLEKALIPCTIKGNEYVPKNPKILDHYFLVDSKTKPNFEDYLDHLQELEAKEAFFKKGSNLTTYLNSIFKKENKIEIPEKGYATISARVGRCEAVHISKVKPKPYNALINYKPKLRLDSFLNSIEKAPSYKSKFTLRCCTKCKLQTEKKLCDSCGCITNYAFYCKTCKEYYDLTLSNEIKHRGHQLKRYLELNVNYEHQFKKIKEQEKIQKTTKELCKSNPIKPDTNRQIIGSEPLIKGFLRSKRNLYVTKDGTIRTTFSNAATTHFKPYQIGTSVDKLIKFGYKIDIYGAPLKNNSQIVALKYNDAIVSYETANWLFQISKFIDELILKYYNGPLYYNFSNLEDLKGLLIQIISPHTSNAVIGRVIGYVKNYCVYTHPVLVACRRRDLDGDMDSCFLLSDMALNSCKRYVPGHKRGALMSVPLSTTTKFDTSQLGKEILALEIGKNYYNNQIKNNCSYTPLQLKKIGLRYEYNLGPVPSEEDIGFNNSNFELDVGNYSNWYKDSVNTLDKLERFISVTDKLNYLDKKQIYEGLIEGHVLPDITGNANAFYRQDYKCSFCSYKYPVVPMSQKCIICKIGDTKPTVYPGMVIKYLKVLRYFEKKEELPLYLKQKIKSIELMLSVFDKPSIADKFEF